MWDDAAVEGRNIIQHLSDRKGFPDDPFSRYIAGLSLELIGDHSNAALQMASGAVSPLPAGLSR